MPAKTVTNRSTDPVQIIAFDFDGTITTKDTFALFLRYFAGTPSWAFKLLKLLPVFMAYGIKIIDRNAVKAHVVRVFFKGVDEKHLEAKAQIFAQDVIPGLIRPEALKTLKIKTQSPHKVFLVSASIEPYLLAWAKNHNIKTVLSTKLAVKNGILTGEIDGVNCWGMGKISKISAKMADTPYVIVESYGDSRGDREMLHTAQASFWKPFRL